jgi:5'-nucleotidase
MDGVLADFDGAIVDALLPIHQELLSAAQRTEFRLDIAYPRCAEAIWSVIAATGFFTTLPLVAHAYEGWERICDAGFMPRVCSAPAPDHDTCVAEKRAWLAEHFGADAAEEAIMDGDKYLYDGVALIDDLPTVRGSHLARWQHIVFDAPYNRRPSLAGLPRLAHWRDPGLEAVLARAYDQYLFRESFKA